MKGIIAFLGGFGAASLGLLIAVAHPASASAQQAGDKPALQYQDVNDPFEPVNRVIFKFNITLDRLVLRPIAIGYRAALPAPVRSSITSFWDNLESPVILANDILQLKPHRALITLSRFVINTGFGFFGFFDPAQEMGLARHDEDFGQTLGYWGVGEGPYLMLPILGPLPPRDAIGFIADSFTDPLYYILRDENAIYYGMFAGDLIDKRHQVIDELDELEKTSVDYYAAIRNLYRQSVNDEIRDGKHDPTNLPDFDFTNSPDASPDASDESGKRDAGGTGK